MSVVELKSENEYAELSSTSRKVLFFYADWHQPSQVGGQMHQVFNTLAKRHPNLVYFTVNAEEVPELSEKFGVAVVPTFVCVSPDNSVFWRHEGVNPPELAKLVKNAAEDNSTSIQPVRVEPPVVETPVVSETRLRNLVSSAPVILFMKGTPEEAKCGFSRKMVALLQENDIPFASFNILSDEGVRAGLKVLFDWPTYPQLYVNGTLIGGLDILKEMAEGSDLKGELGVVETVFRVTENTLDMRLKQLVNMAPIMLFMKGVPDAPRCGFSRTIVGMLKEDDVSFGHFNILEDEEVRQGLKTYSDWPTYPQVYVKGELIGGLDILKEMKEDGSLKEQLEGM